MNNFSWAYKRTDVAEQNDTSKPGEEGESRESQLRFAYLEWKPLEP